METLFISFLPVFLVGMYIYKHDKNKEPMKMLLKLFVSGVLSCFLVLFISSIMGGIFPIFNADIESLDLFELAIYVFVGIALVEEFCKWLMSYSIAFNNKEFEEVYDMIVYSVFVALGFAFFENFLYVLEGGVTVGILRALLAVPGHACDGVFMGYYLGLAKTSALNNRDDLKKKNLLLSVLVPMIMHGIYDFCLFTGNLLLIIFFFVFVIYVYVHSIKKVKKVSSIDGKLVYSDNLCLNCGCVVDGNYCSNCGKRHR
jgi:RsiW-degrading membrane proteinase PrsW (M82 family)